MAILNNSNAISSGGYDINNSLRLRSSASAYLNRTPASAGNRQIWTISVWVKRGTLGVDQKICSAYGADSDSGLFDLRFTAGNVLYFGYWTSAQETAAVYRDPGAWYHIVAAVDSTQATAANRVKLYVNGTQVTTSGAAFAQNTQLAWNNNVTQNIGRQARTSDGYFDGYLAEFNSVDGQALTPSSFGETDTTTGVWKPKAYTGTYGTNGFYLKFSDIATTSGSNAGLGKDFSGNANYWTTNNISVTAGTTYDAMIDSPTLTSATVANYAVLNPLRSYSSVTIAGGNLNYSASFDGSSVATIGMDSGKYYWEATLTNANAAMIGLNKMTETLFGFVGYSAASYGYFGTNGNKFNNNVSTSYGNSYTNGDVIGVAFDATNGKLFFSKNGTWQNSGDPAAGTNAAFTGLTGDTYVPAVGHGTMAAAMNFGQRPFSYTPPTGFVRLNTFNLPTSTIVKGNSYMDATLYTGTGSSLSVTNAGSFQPDLVWVKGRSGATDHALYDSVRGTTKQIESNNANAETTEAQGLTAFGTGGFTVGTLAQMNTSAATYVGWQWQAGQGSTSSNTAGTVTSTVSLNATAGFSIATFTGTGANATIGHGLGVAPKMYIVKNRSAGSTNWVVYHASLGATKWIELSQTTAAQTSSSLWNDTAPTSTVFSVGNAPAANGSTNNMVAYCWAEIAGFSKFGSYTGNGSADGVFVYTGFRPAFVMVKCSSSDQAGNAAWRMYDDARNPSNVVNAELYANLSNAEATDTRMDFVSNGFKIRATTNGINGSGATYIFMAFAENPFKNSNAR
jgi:hypothetical protein